MVLLRGNVTLTAYNEELGTEKAVVTSDRGRLDKSTNEMLAEGNSVLLIRSDGRRIESYELRYTPDSNLIQSDSVVVMYDGDDVVEGTSFNSDLNFETGQYHQRPDARRDGPLLMSSRALCLPFVGLALLFAGTGAARQQSSCDLESSSRVVSTQTNQVRVTTVATPRFECPDGTRIEADRSVTFEATAFTQLFGNVIFRDGQRELFADQAQYFSDVGRLQAQGSVRLINLEDGSSLVGEDLVLLQEGDNRAEEDVVVRQGPAPRSPRSKGDPGHDGHGGLTRNPSTGQGEGCSALRGRRGPDPLGGRSLVPGAGTRAGHSRFHAVLRGFVGVSTGHRVADALRERTCSF